MKPQRYSLILLVDPSTHPIEQQIDLRFCDIIISFGLLSNRPVFENATPKTDAPVRSDD